MRQNLLDFAWRVEPATPQTLFVATGVFVYFWYEEVESNYNILWHHLLLMWLFHFQDWPNQVEAKEFNRFLAAFNLFFCTTVGT